MKVEFQCRNCGNTDSFETDDARMQLREALQIEPVDIYVVACRSCGTENRVPVRRPSE